jgi:two-component system heavy metal sensor histidine kinase CusS
MKSISARMTVWYAGAASITLALLFVAGYWLLERQLLRGLDLLNKAEFANIEARLRPDYPNLNADIVQTRIREAADVASALFFIDIHLPHHPPIFRSANLQNLRMLHVHLPDILQFSSDEVDIGEVRTAEFRMGVYDVIVATPMQPVRDVMLTYMKVGGVLVVAVVVLSLLIGWLLSRMLLAPVRAIRDTATRIGCDNLGARIPVAGVQDDIDDLARLLNQMFDRLETSFAQIRRFTSDASHELKTPLSVVRLHAEFMLSDESLDDRHREDLQDQLEEIERLNRIIEDLLFLSRADAHALALDLQLREPSELLDALECDAQVLTEHHGMLFQLYQEGMGPVAFDLKWMRQVLLNLLLNAIHASPAHGMVCVRSVRTQGLWRLSVEDDGKGLTEAQCAHIFERFVRYTTPGAVAYPGSGLGLAICQSIVGLHGGHISARPGDGGKGLCVSIELPLPGAVRR